MLTEDISSNELGAQKKGNDSKRKAAAQKINMDLINELELTIDKKNEEDIQEVSMILNNMLSYPITEMAELHADAMRLGNFDLQN